MIASKLNPDGYPVNPRSISIAVRQEHLPNLEELRRIKPFSYPQISVPVKTLGCWETLVGFVARVREFPDGVVVEFPQNLERSMLKWTDAVLWIPNCGTAGIL